MLDMDLPIDDETLDFFANDHTPYESLLEAKEELEVADDIAMQLVPIGADDAGLMQYEVHLHPVMLFHDTQGVAEAEADDYDASYQCDEGHTVYVDILDTFKIGNISSFYLTLEYIVEEY